MDKKRVSEKQCNGIVKGMAVAYAITCIFFIGYGILITYTSVPFENLPIVALVTTAISCVFVGYDWVLCTKGRGLIIGALAGISYTLILFVITFLANNSFSIGFSKMATLLVAILAGCIGGIFGANKSV